MNLKAERSGAASREPGTVGTFSDILSAVARLARVIAVDVAHHVTQRGNARQYILTSDAEQMVYLDLLRQAIQLHSLSLIGYSGRPFGSGELVAMVEKNTHRRLAPPERWPQESVGGQCHTIRFESTNISSSNSSNHRGFR